MSWGAAPWGLTPWGSDASLIPISTVFQVSRAVAVRENVVRVYFTRAVYWSMWHDPGDASRAEFYRVEVIDGTVGIDGNDARPVSAAFVERVGGPEVLTTEVDITVDRPFSPYGARYRVTIGDILSASGTPLDTVLRTAEFDGLYRGLPSAQVDLRISSNDIANPQTLSALLDPLPVTTDSSMLGTYQVDTTGDYATDEGITSYKKRVIRRLTTRKGAFAHLPTYGVIAITSVKQLARTGLREAIAADAEEQVRAEPETVDCSVRIVQDGNLMRYILKAKTNAGATLDLNVPYAPVE